MKNSHKLMFAALLAAGLVGCGKEEVKPAPVAAAPAEPTVTVTIAHAGPLTGSIAHLGKDDENGVKLAVDQVNASKNGLEFPAPLQTELISRSRLARSIS